MSIQKLPSGKYRAVVRHGGVKRNGMMSRQPSKKSTRAIGCAAFFVLIAACASSDSDKASYVTVNALGGLPFESTSDIVSYGDFAAVFRVVGEREFVDSDVQARYDGAPATSAPADGAGESDGYVGRVVSVEIDTVVWDSGRSKVPDSFEFVDFGWSSQKGDGRRPVVGPSGVRLEEGQDQFFGIFAVSSSGPALMNPGALYQVEDSERLVRDLQPESSTNDLDGLTLKQVASRLSEGELDPYAAQFMNEDALTRAALAAQAREDATGTSSTSGVRPESSTPPVSSDG